ncbi:MAG: anaerobic ribonucleoside-triphosphate reductase activating protein [Candidatus Omnitrophota bacterium]
MRIAGLQKLSLVDYPHHLAAVVFLQGCNFRCGYCHNPDLIPPEGPPGPSEKEIIEFAARRGNMIEGIVITGGEPTIHADLQEFIIRIKETKLKLKLDTNGSDPEKMLGLLRKGLIDYLAIDIKTSFPKYPLFVREKDLLNKVEKSICLALLTTVPYEFRTTCVPGVVDEEDFVLIGEMVQGAEKYCLQQFRSEKTYEENFQKVKPYSVKELNKFKSILERYVKKVEIRGA